VAGREGTLAQTIQLAAAAVLALSAAMVPLAAITVMAGRVESSRPAAEHIMVAVAAVGLTQGADTLLGLAATAVAALEQNLQTQVQAELQTPAAAAEVAATGALGVVVGLAL